MTTRTKPASANTLVTLLEIFVYTLLPLTLNMGTVLIYMSC